MVRACDAYVVRMKTTAAGFVLRIVCHEFDALMVNHRYDCFYVLPAIERKKENKRWINGNWISLDA